MSLCLATRGLRVRQFFNETVTCVVGVIASLSNVTQGNQSYEISAF